MKYWSLELVTLLSTFTGSISAIHVYDFDNQSYIHLLNTTLRLHKSHWSAMHTVGEIQGLTKTVDKQMDKVKTSLMLGPNKINKSVYLHRSDLSGDTFYMALQNEIFWPSHLVLHTSYTRIILFLQASENVCIDISFFLIFINFRWDLKTKVLCCNRRWHHKETLLLQP